MEVAISVEHLTKRYGTLAAVDDLSLTVRAGSVFGFLGPNGAGKSTTIGCMTGLLDPTAGRIRILGRDFTHRSSDLKRRIGVMPEGLALFDQLYASEFLAFNARMFGIDERTTRRRVEELLQVMELTGALKQPMAQFSTGMRKKVAFAASIIHGPEVLFLDEPFVNIDPVATAMLKNWLRQFAAQGRTVFMTSHVLETVEKLCDEVAIIDAGRLVWRGEMKQGKGNFIEHEGQCFESLETLFLHLIGQEYNQLDWL